MSGGVHASEDLLFSVLLQLIIMIGAARTLNIVARRMGQPGAVGEIIAGLMLGPSLLGALAPALSISLFGATPAPAITIISQIGLTLLMFEIGMEFEFGHLQTPQHRKGALLIAAASVLVPLAGGLALGSLMNTRALMELIVLNIGRDLGVIPPNVFTMLVVMAVVTTIMTGPLLKSLLPRTGHIIPKGVEA